MISFFPPHVCGAVAGAAGAGGLILACDLVSARVLRADTGSVLFVLTPYFALDEEVEEDFVVNLSCGVCARVRPALSPEGRAVVAACSGSYTAVYLFSLPGPGDPPLPGEGEAARLITPNTRAGEAPQQRNLADPLTDPSDQVCLDFSPDGRYVAVGYHREESVVVFEVETRREVVSLDFALKQDGCRALAWLPCGTRIAVVKDSREAPHPAVVYQFADPFVVGREAAGLQPDGNVPSPSTCYIPQYVLGAVTALAGSPDGELLAVAAARRRGGCIHLFAAKTGFELARWRFGRRATGGGA